MSRMSTSSILWNADKTVTITTHDRHGHVPSPIASGFNAPEMCDSLSFNLFALAGAMARTATLGSTPVEMLEVWKQNALMEATCLIEDGSTFSLSGNFQHLADAERSAFAGRVGAGVTDLLMNELGYTWRDNAACLSGALDPRADFIYADGEATGYGVVLAEARGSFAMDASESNTRSKGKRKYCRQVKPYLAKASPHGTTVHGYSISFGSMPTASGAFLHASETRTSKPHGGGPGPAGAPPPISPELTRTSLALASHRSNFALMGAHSVVAWIDWILGWEGDEENRLPAIFLEVPYAGRRFLVSDNLFWPYDGLLGWRDSPPGPLEMRPTLYRRAPFRRRRQGLRAWFAMELHFAQRFLEELSSMIREGGEVTQEYIELPRTGTVGFSSDRDAAREGPSASEYEYAVYRDGLALIGSPHPRKVDGYRIWSPKDGMKSGARDFHLEFEVEE